LQEWANMQSTVARMGLYAEHCCKNGLKCRALLQEWANMQSTAVRTG